MNTIKDLASNPHRVWQKYSNFWNFLLNSYEGGIDYTQSKVTDFIDNGIEIRVNGKKLSNNLQGNLFKHKKEREADYKERVNMSYYYNFCSPIIEIYTNHIFQDAVDVDFTGINEMTLAAVENDVNKMGMSISEFRKHVGELAQVFGHVFVLCDKPKVDSSGIITLKDQMDAGLYPYFVIYTPQNVLNWALDELGRPYWILLRDYIDINTDPFNYSADSVPVTYKLWTREEWIVYDGQFKEIARGYHGAGRVPIECVYDRKSIKEKNFLGISTLADISLISRDIYNACSELREILRNQTFSILALQGNSDEYNELSVGTSKAILYPEGRNAPQYVSPPAENAQVYFDHIDRQVSKIFQMAKLEGGSAQYKGQTAVEQSGVSKAWDFNNTNSTLAQKSGSFEDGEERIWRLFAQQDGTEFEGSVSYPKEFSVNSLNEDLDEAEKMARVNLGNMFMKEVKKAIIKKKFPRLDEDKIEEMEKDLDAAQEQSGGNNGNGSIRSRMPFLFKTNANSGGKKEGEKNV